MQKVIMKSLMEDFIMSKFVPSTDPTETQKTVLERFISGKLGSNEMQVAMMAKFILFYCCLTSLRILKNSKELRPYDGNHELLHLYDRVKVFDSLNRVLACVIYDSATLLLVDF
jgi:hypothetical protein